MIQVDGDRVMETPLHEVARLAALGDNVAIATRRLESGTRLHDRGVSFGLSHTVLLGHRFAVRPIAAGEALRSWGLPFGIATTDISAGDYVCNDSTLITLRLRSLDAKLPAQANFRDAIVPYTLKRQTFRAARQVAPAARPQSFMGYARGRRGVGTRNTIVVLGTSSRVGGFVRALETRLKPQLGDYQQIDGIVALAHTEGGTEGLPNNLELVLRALAGFVVHPNVGAVLCVDEGSEAVNNHRLHDYLRQHDYPLNAVPHAFMSLNADFEQCLQKGEALIQGWLAQVNACERSETPVSELKLALQCGGSDAFSGISANPLAAWVAHEVIRQGGYANLAETDELIGAEAYILQKVASFEVAQQFLATIERFKLRATWHGSSAEGNPSGGNKLRGLYNIVLKSIGAAMKKHPELRLDAVIDYGEPMSQPGFTFMDSPGNDLESIAGQVASGCNLIFFTTGNGAITNFPFVPTVKIVTTTERYKLLEADMDINAGAYLDGVSMDDLGEATLQYALNVASGALSVGERAGHAQVQLWRNWQQTGTVALPVLQQLQVTGEPLPLASPSLQYDAIDKYSRQKINLILPTSLCSGQIALRIAKRLNETGMGRFIALPHTEGCGVSSGDNERIFSRTLLGYLRHPSVHHALLLEHGCEKTHNDFFRHELKQQGLDPARFGWASIQLDGGIAKVTHRVEAWFRERLAQTPTPKAQQMGLADLRLALLVTSEPPPALTIALAQLCHRLTAAGASVVMPERCLYETLVKALQLERTPTPTLAYGQHLFKAGFHVMQSPTQDWLELLTGLGATGADMMLAYVHDHPRQRHPFIPVVQVTASPELYNRFESDLEVCITDNHLKRLLAVLSSATRHLPLHSMPNSGFQITRGPLGVSL
jgi:altronate dehydratase